MLNWQGSCDDTEELARQVRARGAELRLRNASAPSKVEAAPAVRVTVIVHQPAPSALVAEIGIQSNDGNEVRRVQASACDGLRGAVAWVLAVLAQQAVLERHTSPPSEREPSSTAAFPAPPASLAIPPATQATAPPTAQTPRDAAVPHTPSPPPERAPPTAKPVSSWGLGCAFTGAFGLLPAPAFGPTLLVRYRAGAARVPTLQLSVQRLVTSGFESNRTSISLTRDAVRLGAWVPLAGRTLNVGLAGEVGRLVASGSGSSLQRGSRDSAFWFAFALPLRFSMPVVGQSLRAEFQLELDYSPVPYTFRYGSGDTLASTTAFEGRGHAGLISFF